MKTFADVKVLDVFFVTLCGVTLAYVKVDACFARRLCDLVYVPVSPALPVETTAKPVCQFFAD